jgi:hypothetical protein
MRPKVLIEVESGAVTYQATGEVDVCIVDYDDLTYSDSIEIPEGFREAFSDLRENIDAKLGNRLK